MTGPGPLLVADLGNSRTHLAWIEGGRVAAAAAAAADHPGGLEAGWEAFLAGRPAPTACGALSVSPPALAAFERWAGRRLGRAPRVLGRDLPCPVRLEVDAPEQVGADRLANALWAARTHPGRAVAVFDLGTAITVDVVSAPGAFVGGAIAPGLRTGARALHAWTAALPEVEPQPDAPLVGRTTRGCIASGLLWGAVGLVEGFAGRLADALGEAPLVVATGGDAPLVAPACPRVDLHEPHVTLLGLGLALAAASPTSPARPGPTAARDRPRRGRSGRS